MNTSVVICGAVILMAILVGSSIIQSVEAKPIKNDDVIDKVIINCSNNSGILSCSLKHEEGLKLEGVLLKRAFGDGDSVCDFEPTPKKRISLTTRHSEECQPFDSTHPFMITIQKIDGTPKDLWISIHFDEGNIDFAKMSQ